MILLFFDDWVLYVTVLLFQFGASEIQFWNTKWAQSLIIRMKKLMDLGKSDSLQ